MQLARRRRRPVEGAFWNISGYISHCVDPICLEKARPFSKSVAVMKASVAMGTLAFVVQGLPTSANAHKLKQVRRDLMSKRL
jgi:hypothetical protein